ncbi:MAG: YARHG domain-containing protein [Bacteroidales bacterium]|nr:YARHG domain-containing protein [Bacteroidales bacterium]
MMKGIIRTFLFLVTAILLQSNDSVINGYGGDFFPVIETDISIKKEVLLLTLEDNMHVDVYFEFFNPNEEKELLVGFVVPPKHDPEYSNNDSINIDKRVPDIYNFKVVANGESLEYKFDLLNDAPLEELKEAEGKWNYVYYFKVKFKPGINIVKHSYSFDGGFDSSGGIFYSYILKTAKNWAGSKIEDFTLQIDIASGIEFHVSDIANNDQWTVKGEGNSSGNSFCMKNGIIEMKAVNFTPENNINIYLLPDYSFYDTESVGFQAELAELGDLKALDKERLRIIRNYYFARKGYKFKSNDLFEFYSSYLWYIPDSKLSSSDIYNTFSTNVKDRITKIKEIENEK